MKSLLGGRGAILIKENNFYNYVLIDNNADVAAVRAKLPALKNKYYDPEVNVPHKTSFDLQPIRDIHLKSQLEAEQSPVGNERVVYFSPSLQDSFW